MRKFLPYYLRFEVNSTRLKVHVSTGYHKGFYRMILDGANTRSGIVQVSYPGMAQSDVLTKVNIHQVSHAQAGSTQVPPSHMDPHQ